NGPTVSELAEKVKALKAANTIETTPQRVQRKQAAAEEPITARIRKRQEANDDTVEPPSPEAANDNHHAADDNQRTDLSVKQMTFQERITLDRQRQSDGPSLP